MVHLILEQGYSLALALLVGAAALLLAAFFYRRSFNALSSSQWWTLFTLRALAITLVTLLLFRPILRIERDLTDRRHVVLLLDTSTSMSTADGPSTDGSRLDQARSRIADWTAKLAPSFNVDLVAFADQARLLASLEDLATLKPDGTATSLNRGILAAARLAPPDQLEALILFSDGIHNAAGDPATAASRLGLTIHTVGVGTSLKNNPSYRDVRISALDCPETLPLNNRARLTAQVSHVGMPGRVIPVVLEQDGEPLEQTDVVLPDTDTPQPVAFEFLPTVQGKHVYTVRIPELPDDKIARNNQQQAIAQVVEAKIRVLYLEGTLRAEYGALVQRFFSRDPDLEFCALVQTRTNVFQQRTNIPELKLNGIPTDPETLDRFDVILIGDLDSSFLQPPAMQALVDRVNAGAGLAMLGGYHSLGPGGYGGTPLEAILPVITGAREIGQSSDPFLPVLTPAGQSHPILANIARFFPTASQPAAEDGLPPLEGCTRVEGPRPGATVLATLPGTTPAMPVLAVQPAGKGRAAVFTGDTTRNWQQVPRALDLESPFLRFWGQLIRWLANREAPLPQGAYLTARADKAAYEPDEPITLEATVRDAQGEGTPQAQVTATLSRPGQEEKPLAFPLTPVTGAPGTYTAKLESPGPGAATISIEAVLDNQKLQAEEPLSIEVGRPNLEFDRLDLDDTLLTRIATVSKGTYRPLSESDRLLDLLDRRERKRHLTLEQPLYQPWPFWTLLVGLLGAEWYLRKRYQLR